MNPERHDILCDVVSRYTRREHLSRYEYVLEYINTDKTVLDIGCGMGYGSYLLASKAKKVKGIDISKEAIEYARRTYKRNNLDFYLLDIQNIKKFQNRFDVVVAFEVIEHLKKENQVRFINHIYEILRRRGILFISTPNKFFSLSTQRFYGKNPYHLKELNYKEFKRIIQRQFEIKKISGQTFFLFALLPFFWRLYSVLNVSDIIIKTGEDLPKFAFDIIIYASKEE